MGENQTNDAALESLKAAIANKGEGLARRDETDADGLYSAWCEVLAGGFGIDALYGLLPGEVVDLALAQIEAEGELNEDIVELWERAAK